MDVETAPPIFALAVGGGNRSDLESLYQDMLEYARYKGQHTCSVYVHSVPVCCSQYKFSNLGTIGLNREIFEPKCCIWDKDNCPAYEIS